MKTVKALVMHREPHLDEICAAWLLIMFGGEKFPGAKEAGIVFEGAGGEDLQGLSANDLEEEGIVLIGVGGSRFDEHPGPTRFGREDECTSTLVARELGIENDPALQGILKFVKNSDLHAGNHPWDLANLIKAMHSANTAPEDVINFGVMALSAKHAEQVKFLAAQKEDVVIEEVKGPGDRQLKIFSGITGNDRFSASCRNQGAAVVIQQQPSGNVQISTNKKFGLVMRDTVQVLRIEEQKAKGQVITTDWQALASEGKVNGANEWYYQPEGEMILNGSSSCPNTPTHLSLDRIREIVKIGVSPSTFEPGRAEECQRRICSSTAKNPCPWYCYGLHRCRKTRAHAAMARR